MRGRFGLLGLLFIFVSVLVVGGIGYSVGVAAGQSGTVQPGVVYPIGFFHPFGFGLFGILFFFLLIGLVVSALRPRRWGDGHGWGPAGWGRHGWGPGGRFDPDDPRVHDWMDREVPAAFQPMLEHWHRWAHGQAADAPTDAPAAGGRSGSAGSTSSTESSR